MEAFAADLDLFLLPKFGGAESRLNSTQLGAAISAALFQQEHTFFRNLPAALSVRASSASKQLPTSAIPPEPTAVVYGLIYREQR